MSNGYYNIEIYTEDSQQSLPSLVDEIKSISSNDKPKKNNIIDDDTDDMVILSNIKPKKNKKKKKKENLISDRITDLDSDLGIMSNDSIDEDTLLDIDSILKEREEDDIEDDLTMKGKSGYNDLKKNKNNYKKEFAEELTLLYSLLDETSKFGKTLEKDLNAMKGSKVRGVSKYTNELAQLVLNAKNSKLSILKEINSTKKTIADLTMKSEAKTKDTENKNNPEYLASAYFKNILNHGRTNFIQSMTNEPVSYNDDYEDEYGSIIDAIEQGEKPVSEEDMYNKILMDRLEANGNPHRSLAGSKYIEYENMGVKILVKKCIDTGNWDFIAIDKNKQQVPDYPLPTKRDAGRMRFSDDGSYATDSKGRIYNVMEYFLPDDE